MMESLFIVRDGAVFLSELPQTFDVPSHNAGLPASTTVVPQLSPGRMQASAWLYGVDGADIQHARILDLGCADAAHLLPFIMSHPQAQIVGVDMSPQAIARGTEFFAAAGVDTVQLYCTDLDTLMAGLEGEFDYVFIHGVFTLLAPPERKQLLHVCRQHLSSCGLIAVEWATLPGTGINRVIEDAIAFHTRDTNSESGRLEGARAALSWLTLGMSQHPLRAALEEQIAAAEAMDDTRFSLRYLEGMNEASYLVEFNHDISEVGLTYVGDMQPWRECPEHYGERVAEINAVVSPDANKIIEQQYLDFAVQRRSRFSILAASASDITPARRPEPSRLRDLHWAANYRRIITPEGRVQNSFCAASGEVFVPKDVFALSILDVLGEAWPFSMSFDQLLFHTRAPDNDAPTYAEQLEKALASLFMQGLLGLYFQRYASVYNSATQNDLASIYAGFSSPVAQGFNLWHAPVALTAEELSLLAENRLASADPQLLDSLNRKGVLLGNIDSRRQYYQAAVSVASLDNMAFSLLPLILLNSVAGDRKTACHPTRSLRRAAQAIKPLSVKQRNQLDTLVDRGDYSQATAQALALAETMPDNPNMWMELARIYRHTYQYDCAVRAIQRALSITCESLNIYLELAMTLWLLNRQWLAGRLFKAILRVDPQRARAWNMLGRQYTDNKALDAAEYCFNHALALMPRDSVLHYNMALLAEGRGELAESISALRNAIALNPTQLSNYHTLLFNLMHWEKIEPEALFEEHRAFGRRAEKWARQQAFTYHYRDDRSPDRCLRIGFVSGDFCQHPVTRFLKPYWDKLDRSQYECFVYHTSNHNDEVGRYFADSATQWREVAKLSPRELADIINKDGIDILMDLSGHTSFNRLETFALRPAPVSMSWIGYPGSTGLTAMDYRIYSKWMTEPGELDALHTEKLIFLPQTVLYEPPANTPDVNVLPALASDIFTFGSLNRPKKITDAVIACWAEILTAAPASRLIIGYMPSELVIDRLRSKLIAHGVRPEQLDFRLRTDFDTYMRMHHEIDLLLDTFPYNGGTTSNNAIWMGVLTLCISGNMPAGRHADEIMKTFNQTQFLVRSQEEYVAEALAWLDKREELNTLRLTMRQRFAELVTRETNPARALECAWRTAWRRYLTGAAPISFTVEPGGENA